MGTLVEPMVSGSASGAAGVEGSGRVGREGGQSRWDLGGNGGSVDGGMIVRCGRGAAEGPTAWAES